MRKIRGRRLGWAVVATAATTALTTAALNLPVTAASAATTMHSLVNPSFASLSGWSETTSAGRVSLGPGRSAQGARLTATATSPYGAVLTPSRPTVTRSVAGASYTATVWVRASAATRVNLQLRDGSGAAAVSTNYVGRGWQLIGVNFVPSRSGVPISLRIIATVPARGSVDVDDVDFRSRTAGWGDEFSAATLNRASWNVLNNVRDAASNGDLSCYLDSPRNLRVANGTLQIIGQRENARSCGQQYPEPRDYSAGFVNTEGKRSFTYGRFEMRAKLPTAATGAAGLWTAFWLWPNDGGPGELDIAETIGTTPKRPGEHLRVHQVVHYDAAETYANQEHIHVFRTGQPSDGFHTYALEWDRDRVAWFVDGQLTSYRDRTTTPWLSATFTRPMHLKLNLTVGATWPGAPTSQTIFPAVMPVDYVRTWSPAR